MVKVTFNNKKPAQQKTAPVSPEKESAGGVKVTFSAERTRRTKPFSTAANASTQQKDTTVPQTKRGKAASPMFRVQQNDIVPQAQSALAQKMAQGALQKEYAKNYQSMDAFNQHAQDVKTPTVAQRAGNTLKGAAKTYGAGIVNISGVAAQGQGGTAMSPVYREQVETLDQQIAALEATLSDPTMTAQDIADTKEAIANAKAQRDLYQTAVRSGEKTAESVYGVADLVADSGARDINKAKSGLGKVGRLAVDVGVAGAQMGADAALGALTGGGALAPMFVRSAGGSAQQARREGATHEQQVNYGFASGVLSVATEKISNVAAPFKKMFGGGFLDNAIDGALAQMNGSAAGKIALSFLAEGGEEVIEDLLQPALQTIYNGKTLGGSYSQLEASEIINDFLVGGILGGLGGGVEAVGSRGGRFYDSHTEIPDIMLPTQRRSDADVVNGIADRLFARYDSMIGESGRKAIRGTYQENTDTAQHVKEFIPAYNAGMEGKANPNQTNETAYAGYIAGQNDAKTEARRKTFAQENDGSSGLVYDEYVSREMNSTVADEINTVAKALGVRVRMDDQVLGGKANGVIEGSEIRIAKDANDPVMRVVGHEWTHRVQKLAPEQYTAFRNAIMEDPDVAEAANILHEQYNRMGVETSMDEALDEAAANYAGKMIANTDVLNEFIRRHSEDRTLLEKLRDAIREIVGKLTGKAKQQAQTAEGLLQQAFEAAAKNSKNAAGEDGTARFEIKTLDDGRPYVKANRQVLEGDDPKQWGVQLQNYINSEIRKGNDIVLPTTDGGLVRLTERSAYKLADNKSTDLKTHRKTQLSDEAYRLKETAASHIDEIILTGEFSHNMEDVGGVHENDIGEDGFNSYVAYFEDSDGQYYRVSFVSALNGNEETAYSIGNIQKRRKPTTGNGSSARESSALNGGKLSKNSIPQNGENVKKRYSLKEQRAEDEAYLSLAKDPKRNRGKLQEMVNAAAERAGYDSPDLYHGTRAFGFTEFDLTKMDDGTSIFLTTNHTVAGTYTSADAENTNLETLYRNPKSPADRGNPLKRVDAKSAPLGEVIAAWNREADALGAHKYRAASHEDVLARAEREIGEEAPRMAAAAKRYAEETDGLSLPVRQYLKRLSDLGNYSGKRLYEEIFILKETESGFEQGTRPDREMNAFVERTGGIPTETAALARAALSDGAFVEYVPNGKNVRSGHPARATEAKFREFYQRQAERENGIYKVRARLQNPLVIDAQGAAWSDVGVYAKELALEKNANLKQLAAQLGLTVEDSGSFLSKKRSLRGPTRSWSQYAKSREYDGVIFKNLYDPGTDVENDANGVSDVYIVFDPAQVKSTEAVTYDDNGMAIPLSERFDAGERDIRYSADDEGDGEWDEELARLPDNVREAVERMAGRDSMGFCKEDFPNLDQYLSARSSRQAAEKAERLRNRDKDEFDGTEALKKLGVRIENSAGDYSNVRQLIENDKAAKQIRKETRKAIQRLSATPKEQVFAMNISSGVFVPSDIPRGLDREKVMELADYYAAERAMSNDLIRARRSEITDRLQEKMEDLFDEKFEGEFTSRRQKKGVAPESGLALYHRTPQRSMRAIFGWERGQKINEAIFEPVYVNEQERKRFVNRMHNEVRTFTDENGRESPLTRRERAMTQLVIEGKAVEELVGKNVLKNEIIHAAENLKGGAEMKDAAREFSLSEKERDLAERYAGWLRTQEELTDGSVDQTKIENAAEAYTALYDQFYSAINDFLAAHGYEPIGFIKGYAPHFQPETESGKLERALKAIGVDLGAEVGKLPASIAGLTKEFKPNKRYNPFFQHRNGGETDIDIQKGFEKYVDYLSDILYHTDDIMRVRAASKYFRRKYAPDEISALIEQAEELRFATPEEKELFLKTNRIVDEEASLSYEAMNEEMAKYVDGLFGDIGQTTKYGDLVTWMDDYANKLAGKQLFNDRSMEREVGRTSLNVGRRLVNAFARANVAGNLSSALNQTAQLPMIAGELGAKYVAEAIGDIAKGEVKGDFAARSDFLTEKHGIDYLTSTKGGQITEKLFWPLERMDYLISSIAVRGKYRKELAEGKSEKDALRAADRWGRDIMGSRSKGTAPLTFQSKSLLSQMVNLFQVEALNSWEHVTQDLFGEGLREAEAKLGRNEAARRLAGVIVGTLLGAFLLNRADEELYGGTPAPFDVLGLLTGFLASGNGLSTNEQLGVWVDDVWQKMTGERLFGTDEDAGSDEFNLGAAAEDTLYNISNDVPYVRNVSGVLGLGDETLPMPDIIGALSKGEKALKNADSPGDFWSEVGRQLMGLAGDTLPGGRQAEKSAQGIETLARGGSYQGFGDSKQLQYPVDIDPYTALRAALFGKNALPESRTYWAAGGKALSAAQTRLYEDLVDSGLSRKQAYEILKRFKDATADLETDKNENGKSVNGSLKEKVIKEINKLPLSRKQKNLLYLSENYSEKDLNDLPWN